MLRLTFSSHTVLREKAIACHLMAQSSRSSSILILLVRNNQIMSYPLAIFCQTKTQCLNISFRRTLHEKRNKSLHRKTNKQTNASWPAYWIQCQTVLSIFLAWFYSTFNRNRSHCFYPRLTYQGIEKGKRTPSITKLTFLFLSQLPGWHSIFLLRLGSWAQTLRTMGLLSI